MAMLRKDYEAIAAALKDVLDDVSASEGTLVERVAENLAEVFVNDNDRFDRERFLKAVGV